MAPTTISLPHVAATRLHPSFTPALVLMSLKHLDNIGNLNKAVQALRTAKLETATKDAAAFWADLITLITSTLTVAVFCEEDDVIASLTEKATIVLTAEYRNIFRRAGFGYDHQQTIFYLLRTAHSRQVTSEPLCEIARNTALAAVLSISSPNFRLWISALGKLQLAQRQCASSLLNITQITRHIYNVLRAYHSPHAALELWTSPDTDLLDITTWLRLESSEPLRMANGAGRYPSKPYCKCCRVRHQWNQHVSVPPAHKRAIQPTNRSSRRPKASGATASMSGDSNRGMHSPLVYDTAATHSIFSSRGQFANYQNIDGKVTVVGGGTAKSAGRGTAKPSRPAEVPRRLAVSLVEQ
ncbi:hypothetical protein SEPCBS57363_001995 [Sporothrix epigloea]|uniref:Uncharacterized protein n=1 Tax=Sporothrix epigloea TaxID=1892477 RepID=A0ABP0DEY8_9PEZI